MCPTGEARRQQERSLSSELFLVPSGAWEVRYHGVAHDEDGQVRVAGLHQVDVLQGVSDVKLEVLDVHPVSFTLTVANCGGQTEGRGCVRGWSCYKALQFQFRDLYIFSSPPS